MSNITISGIYGSYTYSSADLYRYIGNVNVTNQELSDTFRHFGITPTGNASYDFDELNKALYSEYSTQVKEQMANQNNEDTVPWASVCEQIGVPVTGDEKTDYEAFTEAINLLCQSVIDGQSQTYFAGLKTEAQGIFGQKMDFQNSPLVSYNNYIQNYDW